MAREKKITRQGASKNINKTDSLVEFRPRESATPQPVERDGVEMGVLSDGTALTEEFRKVKQVAE